MRLVFNECFEGKSGGWAGVTGSEPLHRMLGVRVREVLAEGTDISVFVLDPIGGVPLPPAEPGAHIGLVLDNGIERQYSLLDAEIEPASYRVAVKRDANGRGGSLFIHDRLKPGATLSITPPRNNFALHEDADHTILIAGGIGITPIWCMAKRLSALGRSWALHYACRSRQDGAFLHEIEASDRARLHFDAEHAGAVLDVASLVKNAPRDAHLYCCGPRPMLDAFEAACAGWPEAQIHVEYFTPKYEADLQGGFVVRLARSGREIEIPEGKTILNTLRDAGIEVASSCEEGVCGACETRVLEGEPDHRDVILSPDERAENKTMFICCSGAKSRRLVLDL